MTNINSKPSFFKTIKKKLIKAVKIIQRQFDAYSREYPSTVQIIQLSFIYFFALVDLLFGIEYSGFFETSISIESGFQHVNNFDSRLQDVPDSMLEDNYVTSLNFFQNYLNHTLNFIISGMMLGERGQQGGINRVSLEYEIFDSFSLKGGIIIYQPGKSEFFKSLNGNDRFFSEIRYSF